MTREIAASDRCIRNRSLHFGCCKLLAAVYIFGVALSATVGAADKPNIVVILVDDMGWTGTSVQMDPNIPQSKSDYYLTPNLERLANEGMRFSNAYASSPKCSASRTAFFTGKSPAQSHQTDVVDAIDPKGGAYQTSYAGQPLTPPLQFPIFDEAVTIAERISQFAPEYSTALLRKSHMGADAFKYGFDVYDFHQRGYEVEGEDPEKLFSTVNHANTYMQERVNADQPFFLTVATTAIHTPLEYTTQSLEDAAARPRGQRHKVPAFAAATFDLDVSVGMLLDQIDQLGIADNTYVFFTSDNGGTSAPLNNAPLYSAKGSIWEGGIRVPFIARGPTIAANSVSNVPIVGADMFATVSDLAGITTPFESNIESASIVPVLHNAGTLPAGEQLQRAYGSNGELFFHYPHYSNVATPASAVRDGDFKLVKIYGAPGAADQLLLFNLAQNIEESSDPASPLNLASQMPERTADLLTKLDSWLENVDASLPHNTADDVHLHWKANEIGEYPSRWRSVNRVQDLRRETWDVVSNHGIPFRHLPSEIASIANVAPYQPGLGKQAFEFDGNDAMVRHFFQVSDKASPTQNVDNSVSFGFWFRVDNVAPNQPKVLFESGDGTSGLSLTLGDADGDGKSNDLRFRVLSSSGESLTATVPFDLYADPVRDFIQVTAVLDDTDDSRAINLYINGSLASHIEGLTGIEHRLDWDGLDAAGLGRNIGTGLGGAGGTGDQPFVGGFVGQISTMDFYNYAIEATTVQSNYNSVLEAPGFGVRSSDGDAVTPHVRPTNITLGMFESTELNVVQERTDRLSSSLLVDTVISGDMTLSAASDAVPGQLSAGADVVSYILQFDPVGQDTTSTPEAIGSIHFAGEILAIQFNDSSLATTDSLLGSIGNYGAEQDRGLELGTEGLLSISADRHELNFDLSVAGDELLQFRVITSAFSLADFNGDGAVDHVDLGIWQSSFGLDRGGDADGDGDTDGQDFLIWQRETGAQSVTSGGAAVPEPSSFCIVASLGVWCCLLLRRRTSMR